MGGAPKTTHSIREAGAAGPPATGRRRGAFSTLLLQSGLRASTGGVLATKSECKMLASKRKGKEEYLYSAFLHQGTHKALMLVLALCLVANSDQHEYWILFPQCS